MNNFIPKVSVIIPGWMEGETILKCIEFMKKQTYDDFILYLILGGNDPYIDKVKAINWKKLRILDQIKPSKSAALNLALKQKKLGEILIFTDIDCEFTEDFIEKYVNAFKDENKNVIVGRIQPYRRDNKILERYLRNAEIKKFKKPPLTVDSIAGANFAVRKSLFIDKMINFDEDIKISQDLPFAVKLHEIGEPIFYDHSNIVYVDSYTEDILKYIKQKTRWFKNSFIFNRKYENKSKFLGILLTILFSWLFFIFLPISMIISNFLFPNYITYILLIMWTSILLLFTCRKYKILKPNRNTKIWGVISNILGSILISFIDLIIAFFGSFKILFLSRKKSWK